MRLVLAFVSFIFILLNEKAVCRPCWPTDPTGNNPQNPCLTYPPPGVSSDSFVQGNGRPIRELPTVANPQGRVLIRPTGFWTEIQTSGSTRNVGTNNGRSYTLNK